MKPTGVNKQETEDLERIVKRRDSQTLEAIAHLRKAEMLLEEDYIVYQQCQGFIRYIILQLEDFITDKKRLKV